MHTQATLQTMKRYRIGKVVGQWKNMVPPIQGGLYKVRDEAESDELCDDASMLTDDDKQDSGIECDTASETGSIDMRTVSSLGVSDRLSQQASQSIQSQSSSSGAQTSTDTQTSTGAQTSTGQGQTGTGTAQSQTGQPSNQQNATGQTPNQNSGQAQNQPSSTTGQSAPNQSNTTGQSSSQSGSSSTANQPSANHANFNFFHRH